MPRKQRLPPPTNLRYPPIQHQHRRNASHHQNHKEQHNKAPRCDAQFWGVEGGEGHPGADVYEAGAVEDEVYDGGEDFVFCLDVEVAVPGEGGACGDGDEFVRRIGELEVVMEVEEVEEEEWKRTAR